MRNRLEPLLKIVCAILAVALLAQVVRRAVHLDPLGRAQIPPLPILTAAAPKPDKASTNSVPAKTNSPKMGKKPGGMPHMSFGRGGMGGDGPSLPTNVQVRIDHIKESEILGPFMRPTPMALLGVADDEAFLRGPTGQTGMVKEGESLGEVKILKIALNRVLVEEDGEKKELTIFDGAGSDSLMPAEKDTSTNGPKKSSHKETH